MIYIFIYEYFLNPIHYLNPVYLVFICSAPLATLWGHFTIYYFISMSYFNRYHHRYSANPSLTPLIDSRDKIFNLIVAELFINRCLSILRLAYFLLNK